MSIATEFHEHIYSHAGLVADGGYAGFPNIPTGPQDSGLLRRSASQHLSSADRYPARAGLGSLDPSASIVAFRSAKKAIFHTAACESRTNVTVPGKPFSLANRSVMRCTVHRTGFEWLLVTR